MKQYNPIVMATRGVLGLAENGKIAKSSIVGIVEREIGRPMTPVERGLCLHEARRQYLRETKSEIVSKAGVLSVATIDQSIRRRARKNARALRTLTTNAEEAAHLAERSDLTDDQRLLIGRVLDKTRDMSLNVMTSIRRHRRRAAREILLVGK